MQRTPNCRNCFRNFCFKEIFKTKNLHVPLLLECGHTFCDSCISKLARLQKTEVICPECQHSTALNKEGEAGVRELHPNIYIMGILATNFYRKSLLESVQPKRGSSKVKLTNKAGMKQAFVQIARRKKAEELGRSAGLKCEECFRVSATSRCNKCDCVFCDICFEKVHSASHTLRKHRPYPITKASTESASGCADHENRPFEFFDQDDGQPVCSHCVVVGERQGHNVVPIADVADELRDRFKGNLEDGKVILKHLEKSQKKVCQALSQAKSEKSQVITEIREHFQHFCAVLQVREKAVIKELEVNNCNEELLETSIAENIRKSRSVLQELENVLLEPATLISRSKELMAELKNIEEMPCVAVKLAKPEEKEPIFSYDRKDLESISSYGKVKEIRDLRGERKKELSDDRSSSQFSLTKQRRLELKKLSEISEADLQENSDEEQQQEAQQNAAEDDVPGSPSSIPRNIAAAKLLSIPYRHELVQVTHIRDPCHFMVQRLAELEQLNAMMNSIKLYSDTIDVDDLVMEVSVGDMVCAQFTADNQWYRARVTAIYSPRHPSALPTIDNGLCIEATYIDYGNSEWIPLMRLCKMPRQFLEVPDLAVCCSLKDIVPPFQEEAWPSKAVKAFGSLTGDKPLLMTVLRHRTGKLYVDLKSPENDEPTHDDDRPASVRDALVFLEVARFISPASQPNIEGQSLFPMRSYKDPVLVGDGGYADVLVTHITGPDEIYLQKLQSEEIAELTHIMDEMAKMYNGKRRGKDSRVLWPYRGLVCAARFSEDRVWYRALVTAVHSDETVNVSYVDYGNSERLPFAEIRKLPDTFLELPKQALPTFLVDLKPCEGQTEWSYKVREYTCHLLLNKSLVTNVKGNLDNRMSVTLFDTSSEFDVCLNDYLVQSGHAESCGLGIVKQVEDIKPPSTTTVPEEQDVQIEEEQEPTEEFEISAVDDTPSKQPSEESSLVEEEKKDENDDIEVKNDEDVEVEVEEVTEEEKPALTPLKEITRYKPAVLPQGKQFQAGVTYVGSDGCIYAQEMKEGDQTLISVMEGLMSRYTNVEDMSAVPTDAQLIPTGQPCCAQFADDCMWYRAVVTQVIGNNMVEVNYVDFGNSEVVPLSALRMEMPYLDVPRQCLQLVLYGVKPASPDGRWSSELISALNNMVVGKDCMTLIEGEKTPGKPLEVRLCLPEGVSVTDALLSRGLVRPSDDVEGVEPTVQALPAEVRRGHRIKPTSNKSKMSPAKTKIKAMLISARVADSMVSRTELPGVGVRFDVTVTHVDEPDCLFIQRSPPPMSDDIDVYDADPSLILAEDELERLEKMALKINETGYFKNYEPLSSACQGMLCCGRYTEDDMWYRGQVLSVETEKPFTATVRYFDYGNSEVLPGERMRGFPSDLLDLPIQSTRCCLTGAAVQCSVWPAGTKDTLIHLVAGKRLSAELVSVGSPISIELYDHIQTDDGTVKEVSIGQLLADKVSATCIDPEEAPSSVDLTSGTASVVAETSTEPSTYDATDGATTATKLLEFKDSELSYYQFTDDKAAMQEKSQDALLEKVMAPRVGFAPAGSYVPLLTPQEFVSTKKTAESSKSIDLSKILRISKTSDKPSKVPSTGGTVKSLSKPLSLLVGAPIQGGQASAKILDKEPDQGEAASALSKSSIPEVDFIRALAEDMSAVTAEEPASTEAERDVSDDVIAGGAAERNSDAVESSV